MNNINIYTNLTTDTVITIVFSEWIL